MKKAIIFLLGFLVLNTVIGLVSINTSLAVKQEEKTLTAMKITTAIEVDGLVDDVWSSSPELLVPLGEAADRFDYATIKDCTHCHNRDSEVQVTLKAAYTDGRIYFLATWPDPTASLTRGGSWSFAGGSWNKPNSGQAEDRMSFFWPIGEVSGMYGSGTCMAKCHTYYPLSDDPHGDEWGEADDVFLDSGKADMWHSKAARSGGVISSSGSGLTIDSETYQVTKGTLSLIGYVDDKYVGQWADREDGGRYGDEGSSTYGHNRIGDKSRPKYMETAPADYADAMVLTQAEIDAGEAVGDADKGVSDDDAAKYWPAYEALTAIVPERIIKPPTGSRGDVTIGAVWNDGMWTAEFSRAMVTGNDDDIQFDAGQAYTFGIAEMDNCGGGVGHRPSAMQTLIFDTSTSVNEQAELPVSVTLGQNSPNPFNPETNISFRLNDAGLVNITVFSLLGQTVKTLVDEEKKSGYHSVVWDGKNDIGERVTSGLYIYRIEAGNYSETKKMMLLK